MAGRDTNFYYSFLVLPPEKRNAIVAVWDFCRAVDDATDEVANDDRGRAAAELERWRQELAACYDGGAPQTRQGQTLAPLVGRFGLPRSAFDALIEGVEMDIVPRSYETFDDLYQYCIRVASAVGLICLEIFGYRELDSRKYATELGVALQLTNILRDVPEDLKRGRVYIPRNDLRQFGCSVEDLWQEVNQAGSGIRSAAVRGVLEYQGKRAREFYARAQKSLPRADARRLVAAQIMGAIYKAILDKIERRDYDVFSSIVRIPRTRRALIAATTWTHAVFRI